MNNDKKHDIKTMPLDYHRQLANAFFAPIANKPWSMLLRSASSAHPDSRYDILVAQPIATLVTIDNQTTIKVGQSVKRSADDPFTLIQQQVNSLLPTVSNNNLNLPFIGGALGYFGYDLGRRVESLPNLAEKDIDAPDMAVGIYDWAIIVDHQEQKACMVGDNLNFHLRWLQSQQQTQDTFELTSSWHSNMSKQSYTAKFDKVMGYLLSGDCYQINLAQRYHAQYKGSLWQAYQQLEHHNQAPFSAFIQLENATVLSVSPERFLQIQDQNIETKPIKGTRPRSNNKIQDMANASSLATAEKDQAENLMIVDLLRNDIGRVAEPGSVDVPALFQIESFPAVHHLVSTVTAKLDSNFSAMDCLRACFPGGSITGAPKVRAMEIIEELEPHRRNIYCGSIGYISRCGKMDTSITIRTLVAENDSIYAWAGGGLVADSNAESEYQETIDKLSKILPILENL
ncbi:aminodeoxychorismate synthase component 1 [Vibrio sp. TH_r3]|uniref:aminodeoxychorismate synthase component 1 n=1 Tax=Vibrio sp. TH_r3 TaxID=3082084 RepID=UPI002953C063|nr:aminodeoxychorismate synthase component 1 [Vibrio sp. TH_r3]MDV7102832.1 aminodeoxychorismate synthase component 1 [Vibrio sp. TH_r3]